MSELKNFDGIFNFQQMDIRLEVIIADMVSENFNMEELIVLNKGQFQRSYHHDIEKIEEREYGKSRRKKVCFTVNRNGLYDYLPEDIFHQPSNARVNNDKEQILAEMKIQEGLEKSARTFFIPYEQEFYHQRVKLEIEERKFLFETNSEISDQLFSDLWNFPDFLNKAQKSKLGVLMPVINRITGNLELTAFIFGNITGDHVEIGQAPPLSFNIPGHARLGESKLGENFVLGGQIGDIHRSLALKIILESPESIVEYMPGTTKNKIYEFLCNLLIPLENDYVFEYHFDQNTGFELDDKNAYSGRLNYTTVI